MANFNWKNPMDDALKTLTDKYKENLKDVTDIAGLRNRFDEMRNGTYQGKQFENDDYENAQTIMQKYIEAQNRYKAYQSQANTINTSRNTQLQQNSINRQKSLQNLTRIQQANGTSGLGTSQSALLQANANFANNRTQINMDSNNLLSQAQDSLSADSQAIMQKYVELANQRDERNNAAAIQYIQSKLDEMLANAPTNASGQYSKKEWYESLLKTMQQQRAGGYITNEVLNRIDNMLNKFAYTDDENSITENINKNSVYTGANGNQSIGYNFTFGDNKYEKGKNFEVNVGGNKYKVEIADGNAIDTSSWLGNANNTISKLASNQVFTYQGNVYLKGKDGNVYSVKRRWQSYGDDYNNLYNALFTWDKKQS